MFTFSDFQFILSPNKEKGCFDFLIRYTKDGEEGYTFLFDNTDIWIEEVKKKLSEGKTVDEIVTEFRDKMFADMERHPKYGWLIIWCKDGKTYDLDSYMKARGDFLTALRAFAKGVEYTGVEHIKEKQSEE